MDDLEAHTILAAKVRNGQRTSQSFCHAWWAFVERLPMQNRDPCRHSRQVLTEFFSKYAPDCDVLADKNPYAKPPAFGRSPLAQLVKVMQSAKMMWKHQWDEYCDTFAQGVKDPLRHPAAFLQQFVINARPAVKVNHLKQAWCESPGNSPELACQLQQVLSDIQLRQQDAAVKQSLLSRTTSKGSSVSTVSEGISDAMSESDDSEVSSGWQLHNSTSTDSSTRSCGSCTAAGRSVNSPPEQRPTHRRARSLPARLMQDSKTGVISRIDYDFQYPAEVEIFNTFIHVRILDM